MATSNRTLVPAAKQGLTRLKIEVASEIGLLNYEGNLSSRQNGRIGEEMVESYGKGL